jgi:[protein-PII] uridylyltransferase
MHDYYVAAKENNRLFEAAEWAWESAGKPRRPKRRRAMGKNFAQEAGGIYFTSLARGELTRKPELLFELFGAAQAKGLAVSREAGEDVRAALGNIKGAFREKPACAKSFLAILSRAGRVAAALGPMHDCGLLGEYLPEFGALTCLVQYDAYHDYTVDEHTLKLIAELDRLYTGPRENERELHALLEGLTRKDLLYLGALLHDIGKSRGHGHWEHGAAMVAPVTARLSLDLFDALLIHFLVSEHLALSWMAEKGDLADHEAVGRLAALVKTTERLDMLYLLTWADIRALGVHGWTEWKGVLLEECRRKVHALLTTGARSEPLDPDAFRKSLAAHLGGAVTPSRLDAHISALPERYFIEVSSGDAADHVRLVEMLGTEPVAFQWADKGAFHELCIAAPDRSGLFADIAGLLAAAGWNIISAAAYTRSDAVAVDRFQAVPEKTGPVESLMERVSAQLASVAAGTADVAALVSRARMRIRLDEAFQHTQSPRAVCSNKISRRYTVIEMNLADRVGLLYELARAITAEGLDVAFSRIATKASRAVDTFYVTSSGRKVPEKDFDRIAAALTGLDPFTNSDEQFCLKTPKKSI